MKNAKEYKLKIGINVRKWRVLKGIKQKELARQMHLSEASMSHIENDITVPNLHQLEDIADILGITISMLIEGPELKVSTS